MRKQKNYRGVDLTGQRHGRLTVIKKADHGYTWWICKCDCGKIIELPAYKFYYNKSCGCLEKENKDTLSQKTVKHGKTKTKLYSIYCGIKTRCYNPHYKYYSRYGGRGIKVCEEWLNSFLEFEKWAYENGYDDSLIGKKQSIDRINLDGDYEPKNCKWSNQTEQVRNRSNSRWVIYKGEKVNPYDFAKMFDITNKVYIYRHLDNGETGEQILEKWLKKHSRKTKQIG